MYRKRSHRDEYGTADGADVTSVDFDGGIALWGIDDGSRVVDSRFATGEATAVAVSPDGSRVALSTAAGRTVVLDDELNEQATFVVEGRSPRIDTVEFNPESAQVVTGLAERVADLSFDDSVSLWDEETGTPAVTIGGGGQGFGAHSLDEWFRNEDGALGVQRVMLVVLAQVGLAQTS